MITGMVFENIRMEKVLMPVTVNMFYFCDPDGHTDYVQNQGYLPVDYRTPRIGTIEIKNVTCTDVNASFVCAYGLPEAPIEKLTIEDTKVSFLPEEQRSPKCPIMMDYFEPMSGKSLFVRNAGEVVCRNVTIEGSADREPEVIHVEKQELEGLKYI